MTTKFNILKSVLISASIGAGLVTAYAVQPAKTPVELEEPQVNIAAQQYEVQSVNCNQVCIATVKADEYSIYVRYQMDDASVDRTEILNVVRSDEAVNAYIDRYEIEKINAAIVGVKP
jgi:NADPH-dependent 7-cyano-7-deazaguanine reductase QueF